MHINKHKNDCCGCTACHYICPHNAIEMKEDILGFKYPFVNEDICIDCGLCVKVCQFKKDYKTFDVSESQIFAFRNNDESQLLRSQSGAAFWTIAQQFIREGGIVYGCGFDDNHKVIHKRVTSIEELEDLRGSKYVQSDVCKTFKEAKEDLIRGKKVLYSGTSCQIANIKSFVGSRLRDNLFTIDLVCHGVPSPFIYRDYLETLKKKNKNTLTRVNFRDKSKGWNTHIPSFRFGEKIHYSTDYSRMFYSNLMLRESCYECPFTNFNRTADISIADFWGWTKISNKFNDNKGVSLLLVNSRKGFSLVDSVKDNCSLIPSDKKSCMQRNLNQPTKRNFLRSQFEEDYGKYGYDYVAIKYLEMGIKDTLVRNVKNVVKKIIGRK